MYVNTYLNIININTLNNLKNILKKCFLEGIRSVYLVKQNFTHDVLINVIEYLNLDRSEIEIILKIEDYDEKYIKYLISKLNYIDIIITNNDINNYKNTKIFKKTLNDIYILKNDFFNMELLDLTIKYNTNILGLVICFFILKDILFVVNIKSADQIDSFIKAYYIYKSIDIDDYKIIKNSIFLNN